MNRLVTTRGHGFVLLEVILATGIFALAGIGLAVALNNLAQTYHQSRQVEAVRIELESRLTEARVGRVREGSEQSEADARGVVYEKIITQLQISNDEQIVLTGLYEISITARWQEGGASQQEKASVYVYQP
jgi:type II secretory pathway component PulJ